MIRRSSALAAIVIAGGLALEQAAFAASPGPVPTALPSAGPPASTAPVPSPAAPSPAAETSPAPQTSPIPAASAVPAATSAPAPGTASPAGIVPWPDASATPNPYHYVVVPAQASGSPDGRPQIVEVALNARTLEVPGPVLVRVTTSLNVGAVTARAFGRQMGIPQIAPGIFGSADQLPTLPMFLLGRSYDIEFVASTPDGRSTSVTLPVGLR